MVFSSIGGGPNFKYRPGSFAEASRALAYGTILAISGVGALTYSVCYIFEISSFMDFRIKMEKLFKK